VKTEERPKQGEDWARVQRLIELAKTGEFRTPLSPEQRARFCQAALHRLEREQQRERQRERQRRHLASAIVAGASIVLLAGVLLMLAGGLPWGGRFSPEVARKSARPHLVAE
jgi:hypothetical protein